jgi:hypothetical protein
VYNMGPGDGLRVLLVPHCYFQNFLLSLPWKASLLWISYHQTLLPSSLTYQP